MTIEEFFSKFKNRYNAKFNEKDDLFKDTNINTINSDLLNILSNNEALFNNFCDNILIHAYDMNHNFSTNYVIICFNPVDAIYKQLSEINFKDTQGALLDDKAKQEQIALIMTDLLSEKLDNIKLESMQEGLKNYIDTENDFECEKSIFNEEFNNIRSTMFSQTGVYQGLKKQKLSNIDYSFSPEFKSQFYNYVKGFYGNSEEIYNLGHMMRGNKEASEVKNKQRAFVVVKIAILAMIVGGAVGAFFLPAISGAAGIAFFTAVILVVSYGLADIKQKSFEKELIEDLQKQIDAIRDENILSAELYIAYKKVEVLPDSQEKMTVMENLNKKLGLNDNDKIVLDEIINLIDIKSQDVKKGKLTSNTQEYQYILESLKYLQDKLKMIKNHNITNLNEEDKAKINSILKDLGTSTLGIELKTKIQTLLTTTDLNTRMTLHMKQAKDNTIVQFLKNNSALFLETIQEINKSKNEKYGANFEDDESKSEYGANCEDYNFEDDESKSEYGANCEDYNFEDDESDNVKEKFQILLQKSEEVYKLFESMKSIKCIDKKDQKWINIMEIWNKKGEDIGNKYTEYCNLYDKKKAKKNIESVLNDNKDNKDLNKTNISM